MLRQQTCILVALLLLLTIDGQGLQTDTANPSAHRTCASWAVRALSMSDDLQYVVCSRDDHRVFVWKLDTNTLLGSYDLDPYLPAWIGIASLFLSSQRDTLRLVGEDGSTATVSLSSGKIVFHRRSTITSPPAFAQLFQNGQQIAVGNDSGAITITNFSDGHEKWAWHLSSAKLNRASISPNGRLLAIQDVIRGKYNVQLLDTQSRRMIASTEGSLDRNAVSNFSQDGSRFICLISTQILIWSKYRSQQ